MSKLSLRLIVVEGSDKAGKTTLMEPLSKKFPGILVKITDKPKDASIQQREKIKEHHMRTIKMIEQNPDVLFLLDRFIWSEMAYSFKRGYEAIGDPFYQSMDRIIQGVPHLIVLCNPTLDTILERNKQNPDDYIGHDDIPIIVGRYEKIYEESKLNRIKVDNSKPIPDLLKIISDKIYEDEHKRRAEKPSAGRDQLPLF